jgi:hypothetical protein
VNERTFNGRTFDLGVINYPQVAANVRVPRVRNFVNRLSRDLTGSSAFKTDDLA